MKNGWKARVLALLERLGLWSPGKVMYIGGSDTLPTPLSREEEGKLMERLQQGDQRARQTLIEHNLRLVVYIARRFENTGINIEDLISIGTIGLIKAVESYDLGKKTKFSTYASRCIENEILMYFRGRKKTAGDISLEEPLDTDRDGNSLTLMELVSDEEDIISRLDIAIKAEKLREVFGVLDRREQTVLRLRYGLCNRLPMTQREVAGRLGISRSYVSRLEKHAIERLRAEMTGEGLPRAAK